MPVSDILSIAATSLFACLFAEVLSWLFIFRTEGYQRLKDSMDRLTSKVDKKKDGSSASSSMGKKDKKAERHEDQLKRVNSELTTVRFKSMFVTGVTMAAILGILSTVFEGKVVAYLPFEPPGFIQAVSHRNLLGNDPRDCSWIFIYILSSVVFRPLAQKLLGTTPAPSTSGSFSLFNPPK